MVEDYAVVNLCGVMVKNSTVCSGIVKSVGRYFIQSVTSSVLSPQFFCEEIAPACNDSGFEFYAALPDVERIL